MLTKITSTCRIFKRNRPAVPMCPHCQTNTMHTDAAGTRWQCASSACGFTMPVISQPRPVRLAEVA